MYCLDKKQILHAKDIASGCQGLTPSCTPQDSVCQGLTLSCGVQDSACQGLAVSCTPQDSMLRKSLGTKEHDMTGGGENCLTVCVV